MSIGAPEAKPGLMRLIFESEEDIISKQSNATVLMARDANRTAGSLYYHWKQELEKRSGGSND